MFTLQQALEDLVVRGLESTGIDDVRRLGGLGEALASSGAAFLAELVGALVHAVRERDDGAPGALLRAQTAMRVLERVLSLDAAADAFDRTAGGEGAGTDEAGGDRDAAGGSVSTAAVPSTADDATAVSAATEDAEALVAGPPSKTRPSSTKASKTSSAKTSSAAASRGGGAGASGAAASGAAASHAKASGPGASSSRAASPGAPEGRAAGAPAVDPSLVPVLEELAGFVEGLIASGMTTATAATRAKLDASFREASRLKLLRLAAVLRYVGDECGRFLAESPQFSARRLAFFLNRTWLLCRGMIRAIQKVDPAAVGRLLLQTTPQPLAALTAVVVGVQKRALLDGAAAFEFRLQALADAGPVPRGTRLVWSCMFGARKGVPAEAFLHLPQPQKFLPRILLEPTQIVVTDAAVTLDDRGGGRLTLGPRSTVAPGALFRDWAPLQRWDRGRLVRRIREHEISPLDLEVELQEDIVVTEYQLGPVADHPFRSEQQVVPVRAGELELDAVIARGAEGRELAAALDQMRKPRAERPPLYGLVHYEMARLVFQPLTAFTADGPRHLMISRENIDLASLMKTLDFTT